ncbi:hypothetical protein A7A08_02256 [Methyloligella halotolerans]|uniref:Uncharacterized protein n=1 Tax=Methyloligella halotolerans TaxID=1177755 RepID=A0A1E2RY33_9HYPH|nr:hypothetical protein [Methyloligella halotolerans]ODA66959.1 hypothetical protein A7A08_02256 [Methyloligella halotolerans]
MPVILILLLAIMVATFGFWGTIKGIVGAFAVVVFLIFLIVVFLGLLGTWLLKR